MIFQEKKDVNILKVGPDIAKESFFKGVLYISTL
jgi:hypothetical protein